MKSKKQQILIVDDEPAVLESFERSFFAVRDQWDFTFVDQAEAAWTKIQNGNYSVIVSDVYMPGLSGLELLRRIHKNEATRDIPVIMITGRFDTKVRKLAMEGGAADLIVKPVDTDQLLSRIATQMETKSRIDQLKVTNSILLEKMQDQDLGLSLSQIQILSCLGNIAEACDRAPGNHITRVGYYSVAIAQHYGWDSKLVTQLSLAAPLHDVGKIGMPDKILQKRSNLSEDEMSVFQRHCFLGKRILQRPSAALIPWLSLGGDEISFGTGNQNVLNMAAIIALSHHENWDGSGYPIGLKGEEIPLPARIVAYADHYDILTAVLPGEEEYSHQEAVDIITKLAGRQFDPTIFGSFLAAQDTFCEIKNKFQDDLQLIPDSSERLF